MLVRSSRFHDALVAEHEARIESAAAWSDLKAARERMQEMRAEHRIAFAEASAKHAEDLRQLRRAADETIGELQARLDAEHLRTLVGKNVTAHIPSADISIEGVLVGFYKDSVVLKHARIPVATTGDIQRLAGEQVLPRDKVAWVTELPPDMQLNLVE